MDGLRVTRPNLVCVVWVGFDDGSQLGLTGANSALPIWTDFMQVALTEHPEWQGDWQMPEGIEQVPINPKTGEIASDDDPDKRIELFINGTSSKTDNTATADEEPTPEDQTGEPPPEAGVENEPTPSASPTPTPRKPVSKPADGTAPRLEGTITLDIDPSTGLIAVESCPVIRTKTFVIGTEPRQYCGPDYHRGRAPDTSVRPRVVASPPR